MIHLFSRCLRFGVYFSYSCSYCWSLVLNDIQGFDSPTGYFQNPRIFNRCGDFWSLPTCEGCVSPLGVRDYTPVRFTLAIVLILHRETISTMKQHAYLLIAFVFGVSQLSEAQVITCVPCDMLGMSVNVGSQETMISIYHSGQYMTNPQDQNVFMWEFSDQQGNIVYEETIVDEQQISFAHILHHLLLHAWLR